MTICVRKLYYSFRYQWEASIAGTYWYSSYTALQRMDGFAGRGIIREAPEDEPHSKLYDFDLTYAAAGA